MENPIFALAGALASKLQGVIASLAAEHEDSPLFLPHVTLAADIFKSEEETIAIAERLASGLKVRRQGGAEDRGRSRWQRWGCGGCGRGFRDGGGSRSIERGTWACPLQARQRMQPSRVQIRCGFAIGERPRRSRRESIRPDSHRTCGQSSAHSFWQAGTGNAGDRRQAGTHQDGNATLLGRTVSSGAR